MKGGKKVPSSAQCMGDEAALTGKVTKQLPQRGAISLARLVFKEEDAT